MPPELPLPGRIRSIIENEAATYSFISEHAVRLFCPSLNTNVIVSEHMGSPVIHDRETSTNLWDHVKPGDVYAATRRS